MLKKNIITRSKVTARRHAYDVVAATDSPVIIMRLSASGTCVRVRARGQDAEPEPNRTGFGLLLYRDTVSGSRDVFAPWSLPSRLLPHRPFRAATSPPPKNARAPPPLFSSSHLPPLPVLGFFFFSPPLLILSIHVPNTTTVKKTIVVITRHIYADVTRCARIMGPPSSRDPLRVFHVNDIDPTTSAEVAFRLGIEAMAPLNYFF